MADYESLVPEYWRAQIGWDQLTAEQREAVGRFALHNYNLGAPAVGDIDEIKYGGRLVILTDGTRWEVDSIDADTVDLWSPFTKVAVIEGVMYNLDDAEHADVSQE